MFDGPMWAGGGPGANAGCDGGPAYARTAIDGTRSSEQVPRRGRRGAGAAAHNHRMLSVGVSRRKTKEVGRCDSTKTDSPQRRAPSP